MLLRIHDAMPQAPLKPALSNEAAAQVAYLWLANEGQTLLTQLLLNKDFSNVAGPPAGPRYAIPYARSPTFQRLQHACAKAQAASVPPRREPPS
jgi:hypothetical protein